MLELIKNKVIVGKEPNFLRRPYVYSLTKAMIHLNVLKFPSRAAAMMVDFGLEQTRQIFNRDIPSVWVSAFFPTEILQAFGLPSFSAEVASALAASLDFQNNFLQETEKRWWSRDNCSFHRCAMGGLFAGYFPVPSAFCASSHLCEGAVFLFENLARQYNRPFLLLDTPQADDHAALSYLTGQLEGIISSLEEVTGKRLLPGKLEEAVINVEETRRAMVKVNQLRRHPQSPLSAREAFNFLYLLFTSLGNKAVTRIYETLAQELEKKITETKNHEEPPIKLLWLHLPPFYRNDIMDYLEAKGAQVVFEDFSHVYWDPMDVNRPLESIARRMLSHFNYGHIQRRIDVIKELSVTYGVDGVIHFSHWGCRQSCGSLKIIRDSLKKEGLPLLVLDGDCIDSRNYSPGQVQTRIDGFLEMLGI
jgi:benzoyl-CoA reductase/2-hydroxyglutaryl-CoA dehydratase subunit BcrC/BadD/HgdB